MEKGFKYTGDCESLTLLDKLLSSTSALGVGFYEEVNHIYFLSFHVDQKGVKEKVEEKIQEFVQTYTVTITIFNRKFIEEVAYLLREGLKYQCIKYPFKDEQVDTI